MTKTLTVKVSEWPDPENFDADAPHYQWDLEIDGEWCGGGTGPGDAVSHAYYAIEEAAEQLRQSSGSDE